MEIDNIYNEDCLEGMKQIPDGTIDAVICDLPYGTTENKWDTLIPFPPLWEQYHRICKSNAPIIQFSQQPFTTILISSNLKEFRYEWIWQKTCPTGFANANKMPMKAHENICVFYRKLPTYNPIKWKSKILKGRCFSDRQCSNYGYIKPKAYIPNEEGLRYPTDVIVFPPDGELKDSSRLHPEHHTTQKPVDLLRYLVLTYTNEGDTVLDNCMGSGTTAIACIKERRHFIGFELNKEYYDKAVRRIKDEQAQLSLF